MLIDTHCHLADPQFDEDRQEVIARARDEGVEQIIIIASTPEDARFSAELAHQYGLYFTAGIHPHMADKFTESQITELLPLIEDPLCVAVGEIGLDFYRKYAPPPRQIDLLTRMLQLARHYQKPVVLHNRLADDSLWEVMQQFPDVPAIFHCFSSSVQFARQITQAGYYLSFAGNITYTKSQLAQVARSIPLESILIETDAPYLSPLPFRGKRNEPGFILHTAQYLSDALNTSLSDLAEITSRNTHQAFKLSTLK